MTFDPFESRRCRDVRNTIGHGCVKALRERDLSPFLTAAAQFERQPLPKEITAYIRQRQTGVSQLLEKLKHRDPETDPFFAMAGHLWEFKFYFEAHEWLEHRWRQSKGGREKTLQALILAVAAFEQDLYGRKAPAAGLARRAAAMIKAHSQKIPPPFDPGTLIQSLNRLIDTPDF